MGDACTDPISKLESRIKELNDKFSQTLLFLSFALVVLATLREKSSLAALEPVARWWSLSLFFILAGILPLKEFRWRNQRWYCFVRWFKVVLLWVAIILIGVGAYRFFQAISLGIFRA